MAMRLSVVLGACLVLAVTLSSAGAQAQEVEYETPNPGVPQLFTLKGEFVRIAYNNEGYASLGYRVANQSAGEEWMFLEVGLTVREGGKNYILKREHITLSTPDGKEIPLPTNQEYRQVDLRALEMRAKIVAGRDSIAYFPPGTINQCNLRFFARIDEANPTAFDQVELTWLAACMGRLYFQVPGGIQYGQHWLNIQFANSLVRVPFYIMTKDEEKKFSKEWQDIKKQHEAAFTKKK